MADHKPTRKHRGVMRERRQTSFSEWLLLASVAGCVSPHRDTRQRLNETDRAGREANGWVRWRAGRPSLVQCPALTNGRASESKFFLLTKKKLAKHLNTRTRSHTTLSSHTPRQKDVVTWGDLAPHRDGVPVPWPSKRSSFSLCVCRLASSRSFPFFYPLCRF